MAIRFIFLGIIFFAGGLHAQTFGTNHQDGHFNRAETGPTATPKERIEGQCVIIPGGGNMMAQPCGNLLLTFIPEKKGETLYTRTTNDGSFEVNVPAGKKYKIGSSSKFYEVVSPLDELQRGEKV